MDGTAHEGSPAKTNMFDGGIPAESVLCGQRSFKGISLGIYRGNFRFTQDHSGRDPRPPNSVRIAMDFLGFK